MEKSNVSCLLRSAQAGRSRTRIHIWSVKQNAAITTNYSTFNSRIQHIGYGNCKWLGKNGSLGFLAWGWEEGWGQTVSKFLKKKKNHYSPRGPNQNEVVPLDWLPRWRCFNRSVHVSNPYLNCSDWSMLHCELHSGHWHKTIKNDNDKSIVFHVDCHTFESIDSSSNIASSSSSRKQQGDKEAEAMNDR